MTEPTIQAALSRAADLAARLPRLPESTTTPITSATIAAKLKGTKQ